MAEVVEEVAEGLEEAAEITQRLTGRELAFFAAGLGTGCVIGYFVAKKHLETKYQKIADAEIDEMRETFRTHQREAEKIARESKPALEDIVEELGYKGEGEAAEQTRYSEVEIKAIEEVEEVEEANAEETQNVFDQPDIDAVEVWDYAIETKRRVPHLPYVIHVDEFQQNEDDYEQVTCTWYEEDQILTDERENLIDNFEQMVGLENIKFGHGSNDPNVVYVRNERLHMDIEVVKNEGSYGEQVHGVIKHSQKRRIRPNRRFDDE